jgi:signal transduction histidine kinase
VKLSRFEYEAEPALHAMVRDITERKASERRLEEQRDNLDILNQVFRHDIRNDIQLITAYTELLGDECDEGEAQDYVETVLDNANHAVELTATAREMARVMLSKDEKLQQVDLRTVLATELEEVRSAYPDAVITRESDLPPSTVRANDMLGSVFRNLLKNAVQHNHRGVPEVAVSASAGDGTVVVRIADNGPGIPDEAKDAIFARGEKGLDSSGTGIGLYLVETLVENYGGDVRVEDRAAQEPPAGPTSSDDEPTGAAFVVELPTVGSPTDR